ncbi:MAG TPA: alpha/beta hydrolase [Candidatus Marinimicrobia bacterium]|nr:alpha/beta hydrolase [Candidatus Neomarinimicrobiota bacterium]HRS51441.1 alpha/beta hydrolase [Candidatus Neomarinimicrobiota bacterium]
MKLFKKLLKIILLVLLSIIIFFGILWILPARTPKIKSSSGNAIAKIDYIKIGNVEQCVLIRSADINNPIILFLHGGPGMPMMYLAHEFQRPLEKHFTVVQWDRQGAGKTFVRNTHSIDNMNIRQQLDDCYELIDTLRHRYKKDRIILVGHSFGTYLGSILVTERPELFCAYISIGQDLDDKKAKAIQERFIRENALKNKRPEIIAELEKGGNHNFENWLFEFGGELKNSKSFLPLIWSGLRSPEYTLKEAFSVGKGSSFSNRYMKYNVLDSSIYYKIREYKIPVYFFVGTNDYTTPFELIEDYFQIIKAPKKQTIYFDNSDHFPFFEEPEKFCIEVEKVLKGKNCN